MNAPKLIQGNPTFEVRGCVDDSMLAPLREFVCCVARQLQFTEEQVNEIEICVDEACANVLEHAYKTIEHRFPNDARDLCIQLTFDKNELTIRIIDFGTGAEHNPLMHDLDKYLQQEGERFRGLGLYLMHKFMDRVRVTTKPGEGTTVEMIKARRDNSAQPRSSH